MIGENIWKKVNKLLRKEKDIFGRKFSIFWIIFSISLFIIGLSVDETRKIIVGFFSILFKIPDLIWNSGVRDVILFLILLLILIFRTRRKKPAQKKHAQFVGDNFYDFKDKRKNFIIINLLAREEKIMDRSVFLEVFKKQFGLTNAIDFNLIEKDLIDKGFIKVFNAPRGTYIKLTEEGLGKLSNQWTTEAAIRTQSDKKES